MAVPPMTANCRRDDFHHGVDGAEWHYEGLPTTKTLYHPGVSYGVNTVCTIVLSGGTVNTDYDLVCRITTSDGRTLDQTITIMVRQS